MNRRLIVCLLVVIFLLGFRDNPLADQEMEARAMRLFEQVGCPVCEGQSLGGSSSPLASDIRNNLRERLSEGYSDEEVISYLEARYGEGVKLSPGVDAEILLLWLLPVLFFILALWRSYVRRF